MNPATKYTLLFLTLALIAIAGQFVLHAMNTDPRDSGVITDRELRVNVLVPGEHLVSAISVFRRAPIDYFRATRGVLALTDRRMIFLGLRPRDFLASGDAPPTFDERDFPIDTLVAVESGRALGGLTKGVVVRTPRETMRLGSGPWPRGRRRSTTRSVAGMRWGASRRNGTPRRLSCSA
jgi:hypothetical protein